jgi:hypothetical protein
MVVQSEFGNTIKWYGKHLDVDTGLPSWLLTSAVWAHGYLRVAQTLSHGR